MNQYQEAPRHQCVDNFRTPVNNDAFLEAMELPDVKRDS